MALSNTLAINITLALSNSGTQLAGLPVVASSAAATCTTGAKHESIPTPTFNNLTDYQAAGKLNNITAAKLYHLGLKNLSTDQTVVLLLEDTSSLTVNGGAVTYAGGTTYAAKDVVTDGTDWYLSLQSSNTGHTPSSSATYWRKMAAVYIEPGRGAVMEIRGGFWLTIKASGGTSDAACPICAIQGEN